jgi:hypothetical protein
MRSHEIDYKIFRDDIQFVVIELDPVLSGYEKSNPDIYAGAS